MTSDADVRARYQLAFTLASAPPTVRVPALSELLRRDGADPWITFAALTSLADGAGAALDDLAADEHWRKSAAAPEAAGALAAQAAATGRPVDLEPVVSALERCAGENNALAESIFKGLARGLTGSVRVRDVLHHGSGRAERMLTALLDQSRRTAEDEKAAPEPRAEAVRMLALGAFNESKGVLTALLTGRQPLEVQRAAISALDHFAEPAAGEALVRAWPTLTPRLRSAAADAIFARPERVAAFFDAVDAGKIPPSDVDASRLRALESSDDAALGARAQKMTASLKRGRREDVVAAYQGSLSLNGDPAKGKATFQKTCAACHRLEGVGQEIGPNLAAMQSRGAEAVLVNVLDPNREVNPQFLDYIVITTDGRTLTGMLAAETANSITLRRGEGATDTVPRASIKQMRGGRVSIMPEGLEQQIDLQGMSDLISYIMSAK
jgi:putative heme-binding domain-containing protein